MMSIKVRQTTAKVVVMCMAIGLVGCSGQMKNESLESVAKDWCLTIRASQVVPVYPLTEDVQPGDIFLVQLPIKRQHEIYRDKGFLPLDNHLARLNPTGYQEFYGKSFGGGDAAQPLPSHWLKPGQASGAWDAGPDAAFPSYKFSVRSGGGFNLALPVQGVPVGLSLMGSDAADGTITIADAQTLGVDMVSLTTDVDTWAADQKEFLSSYAPRRDKKGETQITYLRVVSRIYLTGRLDVSLRDSKAIVGGGDVGAKKPVDLLLLPTNDDPTKVTTETYQKRVDALNAMLDNALKKDAAGNLLPGGSLRVSAASSRSISMSETFPRPLIIGYLGFDMPIQVGGELGPPVPTYAVLTGELTPAISLSFTAETAELRNFIRSNRNDVEGQSVRAKIAESIGGEFEGIYKLAADKEKSVFAQLIQMYWASSQPGADDRLKELLNTIRKNQ